MSGLIARLAASICPVVAACAQDSSCDAYRDVRPTAALIAPLVAPCEGGEARSLRIVTWNIRAGREQGIEAIVQQLHALDADVILLQEVDVRAPRTGQVDQPAHLAAQLGHEYAFAAALALDGGLFGVATLSRLPFCHAERLSLSNRGACEPRTALDVCLCWGATPLRVTNHHADWKHEGAVHNIADTLSKIVPPSEPSIFAGDLNQRPDQAGAKMCTDAGFVDVVAGFDDRPTYERRRIDYVFMDPETAAQVTSARVVESTASDHHPVVVDLAAEAMIR